MAGIQDGSDRLPVVLPPDDMSPFSLEEAPDRFLVDRAVDGDVRAFAVLVNRYSRLLRNYARRIVGVFGDSDDVVQEALITAWQQLATLEDRAAVRGWMIRITTRKALHVVRSGNPTEDIAAHEPVAGPSQGPEGESDLRSLSEALTQALATLRAPQRQAWQLRELGGLSYEEIAHELDLPLSTVRGLLARARRTLMQQLEEWR